MVMVCGGSVFCCIIASASSMENCSPLEDEAPSGAVSGGASDSLRETFSFLRDILMLSPPEAVSFSTSCKTVAALLADESFFSNLLCFDCEEAPAEISPVLGSGVSAEKKILNFDL